jgi:16S rRNA (cytidine1402-2'-O)-methyltransferase
MPEEILRPALYVVATPIGNLGDITLRALEVLRAVDVVAAEDTRTAGRLLAHFGVSKPLHAVHQHNERRACAEVLAMLRSGRSVALTSDAGPGVSILGRC